MPKLPRTNARETVAALTKAGFVLERQHGGHLVMAQHERRRLTVIPEHGGQDLALGTVHQILQQAGLSVEEFVGLLK